MALIDIGSTKQLFLDDYLIESMTNLRQVLNPAVKADRNPVITPEMPWEGNNTRPLKVMYEEDEGLFRMWYATRHHEGRPGPDTRRPDGHRHRRRGRARGGLPCHLGGRDQLGASGPRPGGVRRLEAQQHRPLRRREMGAAVQGPGRDRPGEAVQAPGLDQGHEGADAGLPALLDGRLRVDALRRQPRDGHDAGDRTLGPDAGHGLGPDPRDLRRLRRVQPSHARPPSASGSSAAPRART